MKISDVKPKESQDTTVINLKINKQEHKWYTSKKLSASLIFKVALKELGYKPNKKKVIK